MTTDLRLALPDDLRFVVALQNANRESVGHLPTPALEERIQRHTLTLALENGEPCGYLLYDYRDDILRVPQACIQYDSRRQEHGRALVAWTVQLHPNILEMRLRCAADLEANLFWRGMGFSCVGVIAGGKRRGRKINLWQQWYEAQLFGPDVVAVRPAAQSRIDCKYDDTDYMAAQPDGFGVLELLPKLAWANRKGRI